MSAPMGTNQSNRQQVFRICVVSYRNSIEICAKVSRDFSCSQDEQSLESSEPSDDVFEQVACIVDSSCFHAQFSSTLEQFHLQAAEGHSHANDHLHRSWCHSRTAEHPSSTASFELTLKLSEFSRLNSTCRLLSKARSVASSTCFSALPVHHSLVANLEFPDSTLR